MPYDKKATEEMWSFLLAISRHERSIHNLDVPEIWDKMYALIKAALTSEFDRGVGEKAWCGCGDSIEKDDDALCGNCHSRVESQISHLIERIAGHDSNRKTNG